MTNTAAETKKEKKVNINDLYLRMIDFSEGNFHDIAHLSGVQGFARAIALGEGCDDRTRELAEAAAIVHDIACPLCRIKYGDTRWDHQEAEGGPIARGFLKKAGLDEADIARIVFMVSHHHTWSMSDGTDFQILLEADFLQNAGEQKLAAAEVHKAAEKLFKTCTGKRLLDAIWKI